MYKITKDGNKVEATKEEEEAVYREIEEENWEYGRTQNTWIKCPMNIEEE